MALYEWMNSIAEAGKDLLNLGQASSEDEQSIYKLCESLCSHKGEAMGTALACAVVSAYQALDADSKVDFFHYLANEYNPDKVEIQLCAQAYRDNPDDDNLTALRQACEPPRRELFRRINMSPKGTPTLVDMRYDILKLLKKSPELKPLDGDLQYLLESWFNRGFLRMREINWKTPAHILEKLIAYEAVHEMSGWDDLRRRLEDDRRCFAFFHPGLEDEPLIFVEVALVKGLATAVQPLLEPLSDDEQEPEQLDTAIFYSISNCQQGLKGISFGNFLIKQVVMELRETQPHLTHFATLSPIPGFGRWFNQKLADGFDDLLTQEQCSLLTSLNQRTAEEQNKAGKSLGWHEDSEVSERLKPIMMRLCAHYLVNEKRGEGPLDPVARFHLGNGAKIKQLNWLGDISAKGIKQSYGLLVNYSYRLGSLEANHEAFVNDNRIIHSKKIKELLEA